MQMSIVYGDFTFLRGFNRETDIFFYDFSETRQIEIGGLACFWGKNLNPWWFHLSRRFLRSQNSPISMNTNTVFQVFILK